MKKLIALLLTCAMALSLAACGGTTNQQTTTPSSAQSSSESSQGESSQPEQSDPIDGNQADTSAEGSQSVTGESQAVAVTLEQVDCNVNAEDGTQIIDAFYQQPTVTIPGNEEAQTAVQEALDQMIADFLTYLDGDMTDSAKTFYEGWTESAEEGADFSEHRYCDELNITVKRADEQVISLVVDNVTYCGGAHGGDNRYAVNFDTQTGAQLTFDMLGENFKTAAEERVREKAQEMQEEDACFYEDYEQSIPLLMVDGSEKAQDVYAQVYPQYYGEDASDPMTLEGNMSAAFYLDDTGVTFISTEYLLQPYAGGIVELPISYDDLAGSINEYYVK